MARVETGSGLVLNVAIKLDGAIATSLITEVRRIADSLGGSSEAPRAYGATRECDGAAADEVLDADEAAAILGVDRRRLLTLCRKGRIRFVKGLGAGYRFLRSHLLEDVAALSRSVLDRKRRQGA